MMDLGVIFLQAGGAPGGGGSMGLILMAGMVIVFYFFLIRPQAKKQKEQRTFETDLEKGSEVVTASGIIGKINKIEDQIITLEVANKVFIRVTKGAISKEMTEGLFSTKDKK
jgi:preprotein translocase subunit YajC